MPAPKPLTATPAPQIDWSREGTPAATNFDDIYFSTDGGLAETREVFLTGCGLPAAWQGRSRFVIGETGFGTGLNFLTTWELWDRTKPKDGHLHYFSVEKFPLDFSSLGRALLSFPELHQYSQRLTEQWRGRAPGIHRYHFGDVTLTIIHDDILTALSNHDAAVDAWFLDGFSPAKNPDMWSGDVMAQIARLSASGARLATFTVAGHVRNALAEVGFNVEKKNGFGRKRHRLEARFTGGLSTNEAEIKPIIIGAGISGASLARSFSRRGIRPTIIDAGDGTMASGNAAAIIKPRLDLQDRPESRFYLSSYLYAIEAYNAVDAVIYRGIEHISKTDAETERFVKFHAQGALDETHVKPTEHGVWYENGLVVDPQKIREDWLSHAEIINAHVSKITGGPGQWSVENEDGQTIATGTHLIIAAGFGIKALGLGEELGMRYSRGQLTYARAVDGFDKPLTYGGYGIPLGDEVLVGTTHARLDDTDPFELSPNDDTANLEGLSAKLGQTVQRGDGKSRVSIRVNTPQTTPLVRELSEGKWVLTGLGSRGFVFAPLLAEHIASEICGDPAALSLPQGRAFRRERCPT